MILDQKNNQVRDLVNHILLKCLDKNKTKSKSSHLDQIIFIKME